jgi:anaerobic magnesium-protoporphyrin IX monomethyl ester cyclase
MKKNTDFKVLFIYPNTMMATLLPLNISLLSACLKKAGFQVELFDTTYYPTEEINFEQKKVQLLQIKPYNLSEAGISLKKTDIYKDLQKKISEYQPDLIGVTLVEDTFDLASGLLRCVRKHTDAPIIAGGVYVYSSAESLIKEDFIDMLCVGEGEEALVELCQRMCHGEDVTKIPNIWVKKNGKVFKNNMRPPVNLDNLPFLDFDVFEESRIARPMHGRIFRMLHIEMDRGCPYSCTYCEAPAIRKQYKTCTKSQYYRQKSPNRIIAEMKYLKDKYNPDYIDFDSESFLAKSAKSLKELARQYKKQINLPFWCQSRPETVTEEKLAIIKDMGCVDLQYGIEHGNEEFRRQVLNRNVSNETMLQACLLTEKFEIPYTVNNIIGFPNETRELVWDTIMFNRQINPKTMNCYFFTPYRGTRLYRYCVENGYLDPNSKPHQLLDGSDIKYDKITKEELYGLQRTFSLYARLEEEWFPKIRIAEKFDEQGNKIYEELVEVFRKRFFGADG